MNPAQLDVAEDMLACTAYKATRVADIVCKRRVRLYRDRLLTLHHDSATNSEKVWYLSSSCRLEPEYVDELVPEQRLVRPPGSWSVTTKAFSSGHPIELYCVTIHWPTSWLATRGYTSFTLGFETRQEAAQWHTHVQQHVSSMRLRSGTASKAEPSASASACHSSKPSYDDRAMQWSSGGTTITRKPSQDKGFVAAVLEHWLGSREDKAASLDDTDGSGSAQQYRMPTSPVQIPIPSRPGSAPATMADADAAEYADERAYGQHMRGDDATDASSDGSCSSQDYAPAPNSHEERWVPYRHTNGVAIYHQRQSKCSGLWGDEEGGDAAAGLGVGSEYMASSIVRGSPDECLAVLMDLASNTTILGPASAIELLDDADERQVLRIVVEATGMARRLCAPREVIVERVFKREECGVDVILFSSYQPAATTPCSKRRPAGCASSASLASTGGASNSTQGSSLPAAGLFNGSAAVAAAAVGAAALATGGSAAAAASCVLLVLLLACLLHWRSAASLRSGSSRSWKEWFASIAQGGAVMWYRPVWATVQGGYTISPREDANGGYSPECLVTCILKVELGGWLGERSWLRPFADALGWVDAYVERMLMAVILVKDEVEQRKFMVQPFSMLTGASRTAAAPESPAGSTAGAATGLQEVTLNGGMAQQQRQQVQWQRSSSKLRQQQQGGILNNTSASSRWQQQQSGSRRQQDGGYSPYGIEQQQYGQQQQMWQAQSMRLAGEQQQLGRGSVGSFKDASRKQLQQQQQAKQKGRLGRMASRIYAMRPKLLRGSSGTSAEQASSAQLPSSLYKESISFNSHITARTADASCSPVTSDAQGHAGFPGLAGAGSAAAAELDLSDPKVLLASAGLPADTQVVQPQYYMGGPQGPAARDATLNSKFWRELHTPGTPAPFKLRGASYLEDRQKVDGGMPQFVLGSVDLVETPGPTQHISRFLPQVRGNQAGYSFVVNLIIPGTPVLSLVAVFINEHHPDILDAPAAAAAAGGSAGASSGQLLQQLDVDGDSDVAGMAARSSASGVSFASSSGLARRSGSSAANGAAGGLQEDDASELEGSEAGRSSPASDYQRPADTSDWQPFDHALHRFLHGDDATRTAMFKLIPHIAEGSWVIKQSVGTVPVILGNKLKTVYYQTDRYIEACCDVTSSSAAAYITGMVRGATKSLVIDLGFVLEGQHSEELPEALLGAFRLNHLDCTTAKKIDTSRELPLLPRPLQHHQLVALQQQAQQQQLAAAAAGGGAAAGDASGNLRRPSGNAAVSANGAAGQQEQQQAQGSEQQLDSHHFQALAQRLQQRCRNSLSTVEGSRTMTGHARSRSAASVEELVSLGSTHSSSPRIAPASGGREQHTKASSSFSTSSNQQQQQRDSSSYSAAGLVPAIGHMPPSIRTGTTAGLAATPLPAPAPADSSVSGGSAFGATPAKQLFSNFLSFSTGGDKGSGGKGCAAAAAAAGDGAGPAAGNSSALPHAYGAVSSLSVAATPVGTPPATGNNTPNAAAAAAGSLLGTVHSVSSVGARSGVGVATPTVAAAGVRGHHRTSSNSDCKTPAGAGGAGWPASPPTGSAEWSSKLSAAAYISRAHAAALAASAARRSGSQPHHQHSSSSSSNVGDGAAAGASGMPATAYLSVSPAAAGAEGDAAGGWLSKRPRTSSSGSAVILEHRQQLLQQQLGGSANGSATGSGVAADVLLVGQAGGSNAAGSCGWGGGGSGGSKITASEQLRLAKQQQQASAQGFGFRGIWGSGSQGVPSSSGSLSVLSGARQVSAGGGMVGDAGGAAAVAGSGGSPPQQQKRRFSHRRFASLPVNGSA